MELPEGWIMVKLGTVCKLKNGFAFKSTDYLTDGIPVIRISDIKVGHVTTKKSVRVKAGSEYENYLINNNDILVAMSGATTGKFGIFSSNEIAYQNQRVGKFNILNTNALNNQFLLYQLHSLKRQIEKDAYGGAQPNISSTKIEEMEIVLPPIKEQYEIVQKIEELFGELDKGIENLKTAQDQLKVYRQAVLKWAFEGKLTNENVKEGELPEEWAHKELGTIASKIFDGPFGSNLKSDDYVDDGIRVIRLENIGVLEFKEEYKTFISKEKYASLDKHTVSAGDIIFSSFIIEKVRVAVLPPGIKLAINKADCFCIRVDVKNLNTNYLAYFLSTKNVYNQLIDEVHGATRPRINTKQLKSCIVPICSLDHQKQVVQEIESRLSVCDKIKETITTSLQQAEALRQSILKKAFEGKLLKVQQAAEETKVVSIVKRGSDDWQRKVLAGHIIYSFQKGGYVGRTKLQKMLYLCEQHAELDYETQYVKEAAGPLDSKFLYAFLTEGKQKNWIEETPVGHGYKYEPADAISELTKEYPKYFRPISEKIKFIIKLLKDKDTDTAELIATIYAVWNNYIIQKKELTDQLLSDEVYQWDDSKSKFSERLIASTWQWMIEEKLLPVGFGKVIVKN